MYILERQSICQGHSLGTHLHLQGVALLVGECHSCPGQWSFVEDNLVMLLKIACNLCLMESDSSQAVSLANPETLVKASKEWVPLFISYAAAKSTAAEDAEGDDTTTDNTGATNSLLKKGEGVSVVSAIGGRYSLLADRPKLQLSMFLRSNSCYMVYCIPREILGEIQVDFPWCISLGHAVICLVSKALIRPLEAC